MKKNIIFTVAILAITSLLALTYLELRDSNGQLSASRSENIRLNREVDKINGRLARYEQIDDSQLLDLCTARAKDGYMQYVRENSNKRVDGDTTSYFPKSAGVLRTAEDNLAKAEADCHDKFSG